jgi:large subunit ribosomal protein L5
MKPRLYTKYLEEVAPALKTSRGYTNPHQIPRIEKIVVNMGVRCDSEKGSIEEAVKEMALITGKSESKLLREAWREYAGSSIQNERRMQRD